MKRQYHFLTALLAIIICTACQRPNYQIEGHIPSAKEGDTVFLQQRRGNILETIDTSIVHNGSFEFTGNEDSLQPHAITYANEQEDFFVPIVIEPGTITVNLKKAFRIGGTPHNDALQNYYTRLDNYLKQVDFYTHRLPPYTYLGKKSALVIAKIKKLNMLCNELVYSTIKNNLHNPISIIVILRDNYLLNATQIEELTKSLPPHVQQLPKIKNLQKNSIEDNYTALGKVFIDFTLPDLQGNNARLADIVRTHRLTFIDFWASWCVPCCKELPEIESLYKRYKKHNLTIVGISLDTDYGQWYSAVYKYGLTYPQLSDLKGFNGEVAGKYYIRAIPRNYLINQNGTIVGKDIPAEALEEAFKHEFASRRK